VGADCGRRLPRNFCSMVASYRKRFSQFDSGSVPDRVSCSSGLSRRSVSPERSVLVSRPLSTIGVGTVMPTFFQIQLKGSCIPPSAIVAKRLNKMPRLSCCCCRTGYPIQWLRELWTGTFKSNAASREQSLDCTLPVPAGSRGLTRAVLHLCKQRRPFLGIAISQAWYRWPKTAFRSSRIA
jgi:hypothetical protein